MLAGAFPVASDLGCTMELLRNLRSSTRLLFLYEVTTNRHTRLRTIAERLGMTVQGLEGIVALRPGRILLVRIATRGAKKSLSSPTSKRILRDSKEHVVAALDAAGLAAARELGLRPRIEFGVVPATVEAAQRGVDVLLLLPEERVAETVPAIEETNAKLEDKIRYETVSL